MGQLIFGKMILAGDTTRACDRGIMSYLVAKSQTVLPGE